MPYDIRLKSAPTKYLCPLVPEIPELSYLTWLISFCQSTNRNPLHLKPFRHMKPLIEYRPHILLHWEVLEKWKQDFQKLYKPHETNKNWKRICSQDVWCNHSILPLNLTKSKYLIIIWLSSREWNARYSIQWLLQETKWVVINNNYSR